MTMAVLLAALPVLSVPGNGQQASPSLRKADADYRAGAAAASRNDLNTALADFQSVVYLAPENALGHSALGTVLMRLGRSGEAIRELERALVLKPGDSNTQLNLALAYQQDSQIAKAIVLFAKIEAASREERHALPSSILASYARALAAAKKFQAAETIMKQAIAGNPQDAELHDELGSLYAQQHHWADASHAFSAALRAKQDFAAAHLHLGLALQAEQQPGALDELSAAYQLAPQNPLIALEFGRALSNANLDEKAVPVLEHAAELDPASTAAAYQLGLVLQRVNRVNDAIPLLQKAAAADAENAEILTNLGMALCQGQQSKAAVPILQHAVRLAPENATSLQNLAVAYIQLSQFDDAIMQLRAALKLAPDAPQLHYNLGFALKSQDDAAAAIPELETAEKLNPSAPEPPYLLGVLYMQAGRYADAERELHASLQLRPDNGDGWATMGSVYSKLDELPEAASALREAIRQSPMQADPHLTLAAVLAKQNLPGEATEERKKAAELMRAHMNFQRAEVSTNSANSLLASGKVDEAIADYREALSFDADYLEAHEGLAKAFEQQGKTAEAAQERQKAAALRQGQAAPQ
jgi:tetratricopeptide (TPR) repeat protein